MPLGEIFTNPVIYMYLTCAIYVYLSMYLFILQQFKVQGMGEQCVRAEVLVPTNSSKLQLWYPNGYGKPNLYPFEATINLYKVSLSRQVYFSV